jgi:hypothetical protein
LAAVPFVVVARSFFMSVPTRPEMIVFRNPLKSNQDFGREPGVQTESARTRGANQAGKPALPRSPDFSYRPSRRSFPSTLVPTLSRNVLFHCTTPTPRSLALCATGCYPVFFSREF